MFGGSAQGDRCARLCQLSQGERVERLSHGVADSRPQVGDGARARAIARAPLFRHARHRDNRPFKGPKNRPHPHLIGGAGESIAAVCATLAVDDPGVAQTANDLLKIGTRQILLLGDVGQRDGLTVIHPGKGDHEAHSVLTARAEGDGAAAMHAASGRFLMFVHAASWGISDGFCRTSDYPIPMSQQIERRIRLSNALPAGFTAHLCDVERDVAGLTTLTNENYHAVGYPLLYSEGDMREDLTAFGVDAHDNAIVVRAPTGTIVGYAWAVGATDSEKPRAYLFGGVHPLFQGIGLGRHLLAWSRDRAEELLAPFPGATIQAQCVEPDARAQRLYVAAGMRPIRYYSEMLLRFSERPTSSRLSDAPIPAGYHTLAIADVDLEALRVLKNHCFADHWGSSPMTPVEWQEYLAAESARPALGEVITDANGTLVAYQLTGAYPQDADTVGHVLWVNNLGVHREHRNRGLARLLLERHLIRARADGYEGSMLGVDAASLTGANRLYESVGYKHHSGAVRFILGDAEFS